MKFKEIVNIHLNESNDELQKVISNLETLVDMLKNRQSSLRELGMDQVGDYLIKMGQKVKTL